MNVRERILSIRLMEKMKADPANIKTDAAGGIQGQNRGMAAGCDSAHKQEERKWI
jgi:hypothetical protein